MEKISPKGFFSFLSDCIRWNIQGGIPFQIFRLFLITGMVVGVYAYSIQAKSGLEVTGMSNIISWGFYISNFTFLVGVAAAAVLLVIPAYLYDFKPIREIVFLGEILAITAIVMCLIFVTADLGRPEKAWHLLPFIGSMNFPSSSGRVYLPHAMGQPKQA